MSPTRRSFMTTMPAAVALGVIAPFTGCEAPPSGPRSIEEVKFTEAHEKLMRDAIIKNLKLSPPNSSNELSRALFSVGKNVEAPKQLDMQGPLMRVYMEFFANNIPDMRDAYRVPRSPDQIFVQKRTALFEQRDFKIAFLRYCSEHSRRNPLLAKPLEDLYVLQPGALMVDPKMPGDSMPKVATARAAWVENFKNLPKEKIETLADLVEISTRFEYGTNTSFIFQDFQIHVGRVKNTK